MAVTSTPSAARRRIEVRGIVQGVGFRPFVYRLARELALKGWVRNDAAGVTLEVEGAGPDIDAIAQRIATESPTLARVDRVAVSPPLAPRGEAAFEILDSADGRATTIIAPDTAPCTQCLAELFDPADRRYRYAFINCTQCGPRYTITESLPYDRARTSMRAFEQCAQCRTEYRAPLDRRFHAEPNGCACCGPALRIVDANGRAIAGDPIAAALARLRAGAIVALKGLGGFHLACDARNRATVAALRERKAREEKPFALMVASVAAARRWAVLDGAEAELLGDPARPIVLARKRPGADGDLAGCAPGLAWLGLMLPSTPLHYLLFHEAAGGPTGTAWLESDLDLVLVMTSANPGGEPLVTGNDEALARLAGIADAFLLHDRDIVIRCDDSVVRKLPERAGTQFVRRARGFTPRAIRLARAGPPVLAVGGHFKNTVCVTRGDEAFLSEHVGDLDNAATCAALERTIAHLLDLLEVEPVAIAHDLHPDFFSSRHAAHLARRYGASLQPVQHHRAHVAAVCAEHGVTGPVLGLALDGVGLGTDGAPWGGELLRLDGARFERIGHLAPLRLPGGDRAAREPWRMACALLHRAGRGGEIAERFGDEPGAATVFDLLERGLHAPWSTSAGRWFDAAAGLLGIRRRMAFEGQAAMLLEGCAERHGPVPADGSLYTLRERGVLDLTPLARVLSGVADVSFGAALFHATFVAGVAAWVAEASRTSGLARVACGGGCFLNAILTRDLRRALAAHGIEMLEAEQAPPNDGGLALGQAWIARCVLAGAEAAEEPRCA